MEVPDLSSPAPGSFAPSSASASLPPSFTLSAATIQQLQQQHTQHHLQNQQQQLNQVALPIHQLHQLGHSVSNLSSSVNLSSMAFSPTLSHLDMVRPASEGIFITKSQKNALIFYIRNLFHMSSLTLSPGTKLKINRYTFYTHLTFLWPLSHKKIHLQYKLTSKPGKIHIFGLVMSCILCYNKKRPTFLFLLNSSNIL